MQSSKSLTRDRFIGLAEFVFESGNPVVFQAYSSPDESLRRFGSASELVADIEREIGAGEKFLQYAIHYPESRGYVTERKLALDPKKCEGRTWREEAVGWGLIQFQADLNRLPRIQCSLSVNSEQRAQAWIQQYPEMKSPDLWDWKIVEKQVSRIIRRMKKIAEPLDLRDGGSVRNRPIAAARHPLR